MLESEVSTAIENQRRRKKANDETLDRLVEFWAELVEPHCLNDDGRHELRKLLKTYDVEEVAEAMRIAAESYAVDEDDLVSHEAAELAWSKVSGICKVRRSERDKPYLKDLFYIRKILQNRLSYCDAVKALRLLERCVEVGASVEKLKSHAIEVRSWTQWREETEAFLKEHGAEEKPRNFL